MPDDTAALLLHLTLMSLKLYKRSLLIHLLNVANTCIPLFWKQSVAPSISLWLIKINKIKLIEELVASANHRKDFSHFFLDWVCALKYHDILHSWYQRPHPPPFLGPPGALIKTFFWYAWLLPHTHTNTSSSHLFRTSLFHLFPRFFPVCFWMVIWDISQPVGFWHMWTHCF